jgi:hypothetical protein
MKRYLRNTLAAACLAAVVGPALANASSSATFGNLVITLTDLNPNDGIAPSMSFETYGHAYILGEAFSWGGGYKHTTFTETAAQQQGTLGKDINLHWSTAGASLVAADTVAGFTSLAAHGAAGSGIGAWGTYRSYASGQDPFLNQFTLSPNTMVTFSTTASMHAQTSMGYNLDADQDEYANAHVLLGVTGYTADGQQHADGQEGDLSATFNVRDDGSTEGVSQSWSGMLSASFSNTTGSNATGIVEAFVSTVGWSAAWDGVTPVPEPETYAMLLGGLALLGGVARRRKLQA